LLYFALYNAANPNTIIEYKYYVEQYQKPIIIPEANYAAGTVFELAVKYLWFGSPYKDYTVKVYSKQDLVVRDKTTGSTSVIHMDGQTPSGFTNSTFTSMSATGPWSSGPNTNTNTNTNNTNTNNTEIGGGGGSVTTNNTSQTGETKVEVKSLSDVINKATDIRTFFGLVWENPWVLFVWFHFW